MSFKHLYVVLCDLSAVFFSVLLVAGLYRSLKVWQFGEVFAISMAVLFTVLVLAQWAFFKSKIYDLMLDKRFSFEFYYKMIIVALVWFVLYALAMGVLLLMKYIFFGMEYIPTGLFFKGLFLVVPGLVMLFGFYFLMGMLISLRVYGTFSLAWQYFKKRFVRGISDFKISLLFMVVLFLILDLIARPLIDLGQQYYAVLVAVFFSVYFMIFRKYLVDKIGLKKVTAKRKKKK